MDLWLKVLLLQTLIIFASVLCGVLLLRVRLKYALLAACMVTPVPLFKVSAGAAGFIYFPDIIGAVYLVCLAAGIARHDKQRLARFRPLLFIAVFALIFWPLAATFVGMLTSDTARNWKTIALFISRGACYAAIFHLFLRSAARIQRPSAFLAVQCVSFALICLCGLAQYHGGTDLDLWNAMRDIQVGQTSTSFNAGFMGLYRGAIGAWAVGILAVLPAVWIGRRLAAVMVPALALIIFAATAGTGSRQGMILGLAMFLVSAAIVARTGLPGNRFRTFARTVSVVLLAIVIGGIAWKAYSTDAFQTYVEQRVQTLGSTWGELVEKIASRDPRMPIIVQKLESSPQMLLIGSGSGIDNQPYPDSSNLSFTYVDSEILSVWQLGGLVLIVAYVWMLIAMRRAMARSRWPGDRETGQMLAGVTAAFYGGILLMYGHFFLLTVLSHQAPVAYWNWGILGLAIGSVLPTLRQRQRYGEIAESINAETELPESTSDVTGPTESVEQAPLPI